MQKRSFTRKNNRWSRTGFGEICGTLMTYLRRKAKERNLSFDLTAEQLWNLFQGQNGLCALSGVPLEITTEINNQQNLNRDKMTASLDRIDNSKPYTIDNVQWVHKTVNKMRRQYSVDEYVKWCTLVAYHVNPERSSRNEIEVLENVQRLGSEDSTNNLPTSAQPLITKGEDIV
jgi:hypothetical protein